MNRPGWYLLDKCVSTRNRKVVGSSPTSGWRASGASSPPCCARPPPPPSRTSRRLPGEGRDPARQVWPLAQMNRPSRPVRHHPRLDSLAWSSPGLAVQAGGVWADLPGDGASAASGRQPEAASARVATQPIGQSAELVIGLVGAGRWSANSDGGSPTVSRRHLDGGDSPDLTVSVLVAMACWPARHPRRPTSWPADRFASPGNLRKAGNAMPIDPTDLAKSIWPPLCSRSRMRPSSCSRRMRPG